MSADIPTWSFHLQADFTMELDVIVRGNTGLWQHWIEGRLPLYSNSLMLCKSIDSSLLMHLNNCRLEIDCQRDVTEH